MREIIKIKDKNEMYQVHHKITFPMLEERKAQIHQQEQNKNLTEIEVYFRAVQQLMEEEKLQILTY